MLMVCELTCNADGSPGEAERKGVGIGSVIVSVDGADCSATAPIEIATAIARARPVACLHGRIAA